MVRNIGSQRIEYEWLERHLKSGDASKAFFRRFLAYDGNLPLSELSELQRAALQQFFDSVGHGAERFLLDAPDGASPQPKGWQPGIDEDLYTHDEPEDREFMEALGMPTDIERGTRYFQMACEEVGADPKLIKDFKFTEVEGGYRASCTYQLPSGSQKVFETPSLQLNSPGMAEREAKSFVKRALILFLAESLRGT